MYQPRSFSRHKSSEHVKAGTPKNKLDKQDDLEKGENLHAGANQSDIVDETVIMLEKPG